MKEKEELKIITAADEEYAEIKKEAARIAAALPNDPIIAYHAILTVKLVMEEELGIRGGIIKHKKNET